MTLTQKYKIYYHCYGTNDGVDNNNPVEYELDTIIDISMQILQHDGDFIGILNDKGNCIQFIVVNNFIEIDIPDMIKRQSLKFTIQINEIENQIRNIESIFNGNMKGYKIEKW